MLLSRVKISAIIGIAIVALLAPGASASGDGHQPRSGSSDASKPKLRQVNFSPSSGESLVGKLSEEPGDGTMPPRVSSRLPKREKGGLISIPTTPSNAGGNRGGTTPQTASPGGKNDFWQKRRLSKDSDSDAQPKKASEKVSPEQVAAAMEKFTARRGSTGSHELGLELSLVLERFVAFAKRRQLSGDQYVAFDSVKDADKTPEQLSLETVLTKRLGCKLKESVRVIRSTRSITYKCGMPGSPEALGQAYEKLTAALKARLSQFELEDGKPVPRHDELLPIVTTEASTTRHVEGPMPGAKSSTGPTDKINPAKSEPCKGTVCYNSYQISINWFGKYSLYLTLNFSEKKD